MNEYRIHFNDGTEATVVADDVRLHAEDGQYVFWRNNVEVNHGYTYQALVAFVPIRDVRIIRRLLEPLKV